MDTRKAIILSAITLIAKKGVVATGINDIVKNAKVTKGALYHYFKSKDDLIVQSIIYIHDSHPVKEIIDAESATKANLKKRLLSFIDIVYETREKYPTENQFAWEATMYLRRYPALQKKINRQDHMDKMLAMINKGIKLGVFKKEYETDIIMAKLMMMIKATEMFLTFNIKFDYRKIWKITVEEVCK